MGSSVVRPGDWVAPHLSGRAPADLHHRAEREVMAVGVPETQVPTDGDMSTEDVPENVLNATLLGLDFRVMDGSGSSGSHISFSHLQSPPPP
ncbi:hypothetical protein H671_5g14634 [Cricetulus griseus]|nr:hypothetical protein H671_5g14634 [Cricetulus griseus]